MPEIQPQGGGRGGMFTWLMPFYTIGVVVFLVYTLFKSKTNKKKKRRRRHDSESEDESEYSHDGDSRTAEPGLGSRKLRSIQQRLRETEAAMSKILEQLEGIAQHTQDDDVSTKGEPAEKSTLSTQQMAEVEERLRELDSLSKLCQDQRDALEDEAHSEEEDRNDSSSSATGNSEEEVEPEGVKASFDDYDQITQEDVGSPSEERVEGVEGTEAVGEPAPEPEQVNVASTATEEQKPARRRRRPKRE
ncbi:Resistance to inhibitors of cholinesterase protein 3 [Aphelenchoides avenae]|nr:Resistance to inhibitors of cholinesterase protein 3 [Aphelenchus avenae]